MNNISCPSMSFTTFLSFTERKKSWQLILSDGKPDYYPVINSLLLNILKSGQLLYHDINVIEELKTGLKIIRKVLRIIWKVFYFIICWHHYRDCVSAVRQIYEEVGLINVFKVHEDSLYGKISEVIGRLQSEGKPYSSTLKWCLQVLVNRKR